MKTDRAATAQENNLSAIITLSELPSDAIVLISSYISIAEIFHGLSLVVEPADISSKTSLALYSSCEFLTLTDLTSFLLVSKTCRTSITTKAVLYAAVSKTGDRFNTQKSMEQLYQLAEKIRIPSALRTLRIATGNKCEFCLASQNTIHDWSYGTFACWDCIRSRSRNLSRPWNTATKKYATNSVKYDAVFQHRRVHTSGLYGKKYFVWEKHRVDAAGETIGPIVTWGDIDGIVNSMKETPANDNDDECHDRIIDTYLDEILSAPTCREYTEFKVAYDTVKADLQRWQDWKAARKAERKRQREAAREAKEERKRLREARRQEQVVIEERRKSARMSVSENDNDATNDVADEANNLEAEAADAETSNS
eukprot:scaffold209169_cov37-Cyclotella_meneghiniana.AAC.2